ncbi:MAG: hypothetical protein HRU70_03545 [Phycisphaeraceae bacterium]|nr:MAG: hypothetical protein HRU70_03545 [Phycisphaeraceae bacterium]
MGDDPGHAPQASPHPTTDRPARKTCALCGKDVTDIPRVKDRHGRYRCKPCETALARAILDPAPLPPPEPPKADIREWVPTLDGDGAIELAPDVVPTDPRPLTPPPSTNTRPGNAPPKCRHCGYELRGLLQPKCPECGNAVSLTRDERASVEAREALHDAYKKPILLIVILGLIVSAGPFILGGDDPLADAVGYWVKFAVRVATASVTTIMLLMVGVSMEGTILINTLRWAAALLAGTVTALIMSLAGPLVVLTPLLYMFVVLGVLWQLADGDIQDTIIITFVGVMAGYIALLVVSRM